MNIISIRVLEGPNYWSATRHKLIVLQLDIAHYEDQPTDEIPGFSERLEMAFPSMYEHRCSVGMPGGFFHRVREGTWMGHVVEHIALELQTLAGIEVGFGRTRGTGKDGVYNVVFSYETKESGRYTAGAAVRIADAIAKGEEINVKAEVSEIARLHGREKLGPSTESIIREAEARNIPWIRLNGSSLVQLGYGAYQKRIEAAVTSNTSMIGVEIAGDKDDTKNLLENAGIPVPSGKIVGNVEELREAVDELGFPLVIKPLDGNHGRGATINITNWEDALIALGAAEQHSDDVIVERFITGCDYRLLVINHKFVAAAKRTPAMVKGDGIHTIQGLIDIVNSDCRRGECHSNVLTRIVVDEMTIKILEKSGYTLETVLPAGETLYLKDTANLSTGGTAEDVTDIVHPYNRFLAERVSRIIGLDICGLDIVSEDISMPLNEGGAVIEVNAGPGLRMHLQPSSGVARNVAAPIVEMLFPANAPSRIPIIAITGTNGKTTTSRLTAHMVKMAGFTVGYTTTDGIYINEHQMAKGDMTGPWSARFILKDPSVNFAVLECARGGILKGGLGFDQCDVAIITNLAEDHLGLGGINTLEDMARVKSVVAEAVTREGYAVLNADDDNVYNIRKNLDCRTAYFSLDRKNQRIIRHCNRGGIGAFVDENGYITIRKGDWTYRVEHVEKIPLTFGGKASFMIQNVLASTLALFVRNIPLDDIRRGLLTFIPNAHNTPGRMNMFNFRNFRVLVDYAHNTAGILALSQFIANVDAVPKVGIVAGIGDRRDEDTISLGAAAASVFDELIIRCDKDLRGRTEDDLVALVQQGIDKVDRDKPVKVICNEMEAVRYALENARPGSLVTICTDNIAEVLDLVSKYKELEHFEPSSELRRSKGVQPKDSQGTIRSDWERSDREKA